MKIRSRGLGRRELQMDLHEFKITKEGHEVIVSGVTHAPVTWETSIRIAPEDIGGMLRVACSPKVLAMGVRWALHLKTPETAAPPPEWERRSGSTTLRSHSGASAKARGGVGGEPDRTPGASMPDASRCAERAADTSA